MASNGQILNYNRRKKHKYLMILICLILFVSIGFAMLSGKFDIKGSPTVIDSIWDVHFDNLNEIDGSVEALEKAIIDPSELNINYVVNLDKPGDYYEFTVDVVNDGTIDAKLMGLPVISGISDDQDKYINYSIVHTDGTPIVLGESLKVGESINYTVRVEFDSNIVGDSDLPKTDQSINLIVTMEYDQD